jgi:hypothetical protein
MQFSNFQTDFWAIVASMKNTATILNLVFLGTKFGLFCYFFQDVINFIF